MALSSKEILETWFEQVWHLGREDAVYKLMAPGCVFHGLPGPDGQPIKGPEAFLPFFRQFRDAFPDVRLTVERTVENGGSVALYCRVTGTHTGDLGTFPASSAAIDMTGMVMARTENGMIQEGWNVFDFLSMYRQIGLLPS